MLEEDNNKIEDNKIIAQGVRADSEIITKKNKADNKKEDEKPTARNAKRPKDLKQKQEHGQSLKWALFIFVMTFILSLSFSFIAQKLSSLQIILAFIVLVFTIIMSIIFDIIGVAAAACSLEPFLAMASRKMYGAKLAVKIAKNAEKVSNICGDVIGDICGIISGTLGALIVLKLINDVGVTLDSTLLSILFSSSIAAITVGGKALGKKFAINNSNSIIYFVSKILSVFSRKG